MKKKKDTLSAQTEKFRNEMGKDKKLKSEIKALQNKLAVAQASFDALDTEKETKVCLIFICLGGGGASLFY